jgi:hypothetical protein
MSDPRERLLRCHYCRADNPVEATACWLCEARDWNPTLHAPGPVKGEGELLVISDAGKPIPIPPAPRGGVRTFFAAVFTACALFGVTLMIYIGLWDSAPGLATVLVLAWWLALGTAIARRNKHPGAANAFLVVVSVIGMIFAGITVLGVSLVVLLLIVCFANRPPNFH